MEGGEEGAGGLGISPPNLGNEWPRKNLEGCFWGVE